MVWDVIDASKAHVAYAVVAVFSTVFSLCSLFVKEKLYLGEASVATIYGLIVGPHCLNWFNPLSWGNYFSITLEISRVLLCIEIVAVSVELPKKYVLKHWFSLFLLLIPCMTAGWLIIGAFIYAIIPGLTFTYGLLISACVTATDPILAQAVVGKGKFAKRVPAHLRNLLSAESACNDGISVPFVFLALNLILHSGNSKEIAKDWICVTVLYECGFGCIMGSLIGYLGRRSLKFAEKHELIDHESFLAFYIMLALLCAGFGSVLGVDDLLASFCAGSAFAWDGWFTDRTEESNVSTVIDILLNMAYFVYFGSIIPWEEFNDPSIGLDCWRLVILAIVVLILRRLPAVLLTKSLNPDIKNWKEAIFVGHFGPIGVGAVFAAIIAISDLEADVLHITHGPSTNYPQSSEFYQLIRIVWPVVCFLIVTSIIVHGSSVAVLTLGKQLQTMTFTMTWTKAETDGGKEGYWFNRLPKIERSGTSFSLRRVDTLANQAYDSDYKVSPSGTGAITDDEFGDEKVNAMLNANIGMERFGDVNDIPEHVSASKKGKPIGGANRKKQRRLLKRKKTKSTKRPPISETLDLSASHRNTSSIDYGNPVDEVDLGDEDEIRSDQINQQESLPETGKEEVPTAGESSRRESRISIPLQRILSNGSRSRSRSSTSAGFQGTIHANRDAIEKIKKDFDLSDEVLQPIEDEDGDLRVPTNVYNYNNNLVIEDQHGEVMHNVRSRANSIDTNNSLGSKRSRGNTLAKNITSAIGFSHGDGESSSSDSKDSSKIPKPTTIEEQLEDLEGAAETEGTHKVESLQNLLRRTTLGTIKGISEGLFPKNELPRKTRKIHGYRVNDDIIIENEDGEILGRYKVNVKKQKAVQTAEGINSKEYDKSVVNKAMKYFGLMKQQEVVDEELNEINNEDFIPEQGNDFTSDGLEDRIKHFINADPKKVVVSLPQDLHHVRMGSGNLRKKLTKQKKRGMKKDKASASLQLPPPPQINIEDEDSEIDDIDDDADGDDQNTNADGDDSLETI